MSETATTTAVPTRSEVPASDCWDLSRLFETTEDWEAALEQLQERTEEARGLEDALGEGPAGAEKVLHFWQANALLDERLGYYAFLRNSEDAGDSTNQDRLARYSAASAAYQAAFSWFDPALQDLPEEQADALLADPGLADFRIYLQRVFRYRAHRLSAAEERLLAQQRESAQTASKAFQALSDVDADFGTVDTPEGERPLTHASYGGLLEHRDRGVRHQAYNQLHGFYRDHVNTLTALYAGNVHQGIFEARARRFDSAREASLFADDVPVPVYDGLIDAVRAHLPALHRYHALRARVLGLDDYGIHDTRVPLVPDLEVRHTWDEAVQATCEAMSPLGDEYVDALREGLAGRWADRYENKGKRSGAFSAGSFTGDPYILMNFEEDQFRDVFTLAHEAGHSMHSRYSVRGNPFPHYRYTIFVAEVASTFNEQLLLHHYREQRRDDPVFLAMLLTQEIDQVVGTIYRQAQFAAFERDMHAQVEAGGSLTVDSVVGHYQQLQEEWYGPDVQLAEVARFEALRIPHFYRAFYVYKYATGLAAAMVLADGVLSGQDGALERYHAFLSSGGNAFPIEQLRVAGVDMADPAPVEAALTRFGNRVDQLADLLDASA